MMTRPDPTIPHNTENPAGDFRRASRKTVSMGATQDMDLLKVAPPCSKRKEHRTNGRDPHKT